MQTLDDLDLFDPRNFVHGPPHELFDEMRSLPEIFWSRHEGERDGGFWVVTRHEDAVTVSRDTASFTSSKGFTAPRPAQINPAFLENIMYRDPPAHTQHRKPLNRSFTPKAMSALEPTVRTMVNDILDVVRRHDHFDWVQNVAAELPARVVASMLGVEGNDHTKFVRWANDIFGRDGSPEREVLFNESVAAIMGYAQSLKDDKRACPGHDLMSLLLAADVDGAPLSELAVSMWFLTVAQAGFETTHTLIAQGMRLVLERPDLRDRLLTDRAAIPRIVEEMLRYITPVNMMARTAVEDVEVGAASVKAGQYVTLWYCATNRDPAVFTSPHTFDPDRSPNNHQAFGAFGSPHYCLGAHLARLEMRLLLEELVDRGIPFRSAGDAQRMPGVFLNALKQLPVASARS